MSKYARDGVPPETDRPDGIQRDPGVISPWMAWNLTKHGPDRHGWAIHYVEGGDAVRAIRHVETGEVLHVADGEATVGTVDEATARKLVGRDGDGLAPDDLEVGFQLGRGGRGGDESPWKVVGEEVREGRVYQVIKKRDVQAMYRVLPPREVEDAGARDNGLTFYGDESGGGRVLPTSWGGEDG